MTRRPFWVRSVSAGPVVGEASNWIIRTLVKDRPAAMGSFSAYLSLLAAGHIPHGMHAHDEEEIIVLLLGHLDVHTPHLSRRIGPGSFFFHSPGDEHTHRSVGPESAVFLVFKWRSWEFAANTQPEAALPLFDADDLKAWPDRAGIHRQRVCEGLSLANGGMLVADAIRIAPRTGYPAHSHDHDLMLILLRGQMNALGHVTSAPAVVYYPAGTPHALSALRQDPIDMLAFEFHQPSSR